MRKGYRAFLLGTATDLPCRGYYLNRGGSVPSIGNSASNAGVMGRSVKRRVTSIGTPDKD